LLDCLDWVPNRGACIDACLSCDVTRSFQLHDIKALRLIAEMSVKNDASGGVED